MSLTLASKPTYIEWKNLRFLIMDAPKQANLHLYLKECEKYHVTQLVRISEPTYEKADVERAGIALHVRQQYITPPHIIFGSLLNCLDVKRLTDLCILIHFYIPGNVLRRWSESTTGDHRQVERTSERNISREEKQGW
jgi:hypothetical protein